ncbi:MAG: secretin N-terminal domain-containing protein [Candidatus Omnitrophota bacterium]|nr:secretin N-terminal domain-containing protein [Candidatus Omnitrophota bacterium]
MVHRLLILFIMVAFLSPKAKAADEKNLADTTPPVVENTASVQTTETKEPENAVKEEPSVAAKIAAQEAPVPAASVPEASVAEPPVPKTAILEAPVKEEPAPIPSGNVTVNFKGADIRTVLSYISEVAGVDVIAAPDVKGIIDLKLTDKPWKVALDIIVRNYGFAYERNGDIIRVVTLDKLKQEEAVTQAFALNYGKAKEIVGAVEDMVGDRGNVLYDDRTNMVLVTDIPTNVYKIGQIIQKLDRETDQVLIEARVLETVLDDNERMGIDWNIKIAATGAKRPITFPFDNFDPDSKYLQKYYPLDQTGTDSTTTGAGGVSGSTTTAAFPTGANGSTAFPFVDITQDIFKNSFTFGTLDFTQFSAVLEMIKKRADTNVVSNPRVATLNNNPAYIIVGQTINMPKYERNSTTGKMEVSGYDAKDLGIKLKVTPHINEKSEIMVDIAPEISDFLRYDTLDASSGIVAPVFSSRQANTKVMIKDQDTIFIGGMIKENIIDVKKPIPFIGDLLGDVPYLGLLVSKKEKAKQKTELIFFITVKLMKAGAKLGDVPSIERTYKPNYDYNQEKWQKNIKKRKIK